MTTPQNLINGLHQQIWDLAQQHALPESQLANLFRHADEVIAWNNSFRYHLPFHNVQVRSLSDGRVLLLGTQYNERMESWTLRLFPIHSADHTQVGWLAAQETSPETGILIIEDFSLSSAYQNQGLGSWMLRTFTACQAPHFSAVIGSIATRDWGQVSMLEHFYTKHGFTVTLDHQKHQGTIYSPLVT